MAEESWDTEVADTNMGVEQQYVPEMPEIKLFGRWSYGDVQVSDMSLIVNNRSPKLILLSSEIGKISSVILCI